MSDPMAPSATYDIFTDGSCSFCRWMRTKVEPYDSGKQLRFLDYNNPSMAALAPFPIGELAREIHVRTPEGNWAIGFEGWLVLLRTLPKLAWIGRAAGSPLLLGLGPSAYRFIARHRYSIPGAPRRCASDTCADRGVAPRWAACRLHRVPCPRC